MATESTRDKWISIFFFAIVLAVGILVFRDYGVHYDEKCQIVIGVTNYRYINQGDPSLLEFQDRYYGPLFELPLVVLFHDLPAPWMVYLRHLSVFLTFFCGSIAFYFIARRLFRNARWALLACLLLTTNPRIFADAFYNSKDIPFMVILILGIASLIHWLDVLENKPFTRPVWMAVLLHALISAAAVAIRIPGLVLTGITIGVLLLEIFARPVQWRQKVVILGVYLIVTFAFIIFFMPVMWHDPFREFANAISQMSRYNLWTGSILFQGNMFPANNPVWNYLPVWIGITTPYLSLAGFGIGILLILIMAFRQAGKIFEPRSVLTKENLTWMAAIAWFIVPVAALYIFRSVLYDAWRQMFFIYPPMVLIAVYGIRRVCAWMSDRFLLSRFLLGGILIIGILEPLTWMLHNHPHENVYFNRLAGDKATLRWRYDLDYWGLSYKQGIDHILATDTRDQIKLSAVGPPSLYVEYMLPQETAARLSFVEPDEADYFLTNYRWHPDDFPYPEKYYSVNVDDMEIMTVYRIQEPAEPDQN